VEALSTEHDVTDIALAAVSLADAEARGAEDTTELAPAVLPASERPARPGHGAGTRPRYGEERQGGFVRRQGPPPRNRPGEPAGERSPEPHRPPGTGPATDAVPPGPRRGYRATAWRDGDGRPVARVPRGAAIGGVTRLFVGAGRAAGMRPGDLVGAITNEAGLQGGDIGAIQIADGFSLVEVPDAAADRVIQALRGATIRGQKVTVRRERF
jgi:hypothetical protein